MSDEEIICAWMDPTREDGDWWTTKNFANFGNSYTIVPERLTLDKLWEVEERLPERSQLDYWMGLAKGGPLEVGYWRLVHVSAEKKIKALAAIVSTLPPAKEEKKSR